VIVRTDSPITRTVSQRLGGRWATSLQSGVITCTLAILIFLSEGLSASPDPQVELWVALVLLAAGASSLTAFALHLTVFSQRSVTPLPVWAVLLANAGLAMIFNLVVWTGAVVWALPTGSANIRSLTITCLLGMWWGAMLTIFLDYRQESSASHEELIGQAIQAKLLDLHQNEIARRLAREVSAEVDDELKEAREKLNSFVEDANLRTDIPLFNSAEWSAVSDALRSTAEGSLRPISKRMWQQEDAQYPRMPWWSLPSNVIHFQPFRPWMLVMIHVVATSSQVLRIFGTLPGLLLLAVESGVILAVTVIANNAMKRYPSHHAMIFVAGIVVLQLTIPLRALVRNEWSPGSATLGWQATQVVVGVIIILATSGVGAWADKAGQMRANFRRQLDQDRIESAARSQCVVEYAREASQVLHGAVQTRLMTCAMAIDQANTSGDSLARTEALRQAILVLKSPLNHERSNGSLTEEVERKIAMWRGLCHVTLVVEEIVNELQINDSLIYATSLIVEEGLANAIRRGDAESVHITISCKVIQVLNIVIDDDGIGPAGGELGLGSALIEQVTGGNWSLTPLVRGSRLEANVLTLVPQDANGGLN
jgi:hypothetical protein